MKGNKKMRVLNIGGNDYKIEYGFNCFADTDLLEKVEEISVILAGNNVETDSDVSQIGKIKDLFVIVRELLFVGFQKHNPLDTLQEVGDLCDVYHSEATEDDDHGLISLFTILSMELTEEGFLKDLLTEVENQKVTKIPQDHKRTSKK